MEVWGWRIPFILAFFTAVLGIWMRRGMPEPHAFLEAARREGCIPSARFSQRQLKLVGGASAGWGAGAGADVEASEAAGKKEEAPGSEDSQGSGADASKPEPERVASGSLAKLVGAGHVSHAKVRKQRLRCWGGCRGAAVQWVPSGMRPPEGPSQPAPAAPLAGARHASAARQLGGGGPPALLHVLVRGSRLPARPLRMPKACLHLACGARAARWRALSLGRQFECGPLVFLLFPLRRASCFFYTFTSWLPSKQRALGVVATRVSQGQLLASIPFGLAGYLGAGWALDRGVRSIRANMLLVTASAAAGGWREGRGAAVAGRGGLGRGGSEQGRGAGRKAGPLGPPPAAPDSWRPLCHPPPFTAAFGACYACFASELASWIVLPAILIPVGASITLIG